jgi:DNA-binding PadR family transcriptional regulator
MSLQYAILGLLSYKSMTGYDLKKMFDESVNNFWAASLSQIYRELGVLESKNYLTSVIQHQDDRPDKRVYSITETGRISFKNWITNFPEKLSKEKRDEFTLRIFFGSNLSCEELIVQFQRFIDEKKRSMDEIAKINEIAKKYSVEMNLKSSEEIYWKFVLKRARLTLEALIKWANECIEDLKNEGEKSNERV